MSSENESNVAMVRKWVQHMIPPQMPKTRQIPPALCACIWPHFLFGIGGNCSTELISGLDKATVTSSLADNVCTGSLGATPAAAADNSSPELLEGFSSGGIDAISEKTRRAELAATKGVVCHGHVGFKRDFAVHRVAQRLRTDVCASWCCTTACGSQRRQPKRPRGGTRGGAAQEGCPARRPPVDA